MSPEQPSSAPKGREAPAPVPNLSDRLAKTRDPAEITRIIMEANGHQRAMTADKIQNLNARIVASTAEQREHFGTMQTFNAIGEQNAARHPEVHALALQKLQAAVQVKLQEVNRPLTYQEVNILYNRAQLEATQEAMNNPALHERFVRDGVTKEQMDVAMKQRKSYFKSWEIIHLGTGPEATPDQKENANIMMKYTALANREIARIERERGQRLPEEAKFEVIMRFHEQALKEITEEHLNDVYLDPEEKGISPAEKDRREKFNEATGYVFYASPEGRETTLTVLQLSREMRQAKDPKEKQRIRGEIETKLRAQYGDWGHDLTQEQIDRIIDKHVDPEFEKLLRDYENRNVILQHGSPKQRAAAFRMLVSGDDEGMLGIVSDIGATTKDPKLKAKIDKSVEQTRKVNEAVRTRAQERSQRALAALNGISSPASYASLPVEQQVAVGRSLEQGADPSFIGVMLENAQPTADGLQSNIEGMTVTLDSSGRAVLEGTRNMDEASARGFEESMVVLLAQRTGAGEAFRSERSDTRALVKALTRINVRDQNIDGADRYAKLEETMTELFARSQGDAFAVLENMKIIDGGVPNLSLARAWGAQLRVLGDSRTLPLATYERIAEEWKRTGEPYELFTPVTVALLEQTPIEEESSPESESALA